jgi:hypothetical protein
VSDQGKLQKHPEWLASGVIIYLHRNEYKILIQKPEGKEPLGRPRHK